MRVDRGRLQLAVPQEDLDRADVDVLLQEVGGEAMAQGVQGDRLPDPGAPLGLVGRRG